MNDHDMPPPPTVAAIVVLAAIGWIAATIWWLLT
jgi:hypothetical protein